MADTVDAPAIEIEGMSVFRGRSLAVDRVAMTAGRAKWFGLIGANGSGKTSLLRAVAGRLPCSVASCRIDGIELCDDPRARAQRIGYMPPAEFLPEALTCRQVFTLVQPNEETWRKGMGPLYTALALDKLLDRKIGDCSAGMKQRVAIGCAFAPHNTMVILDEPFNWLDPIAAYDLRHVLRSLVDEGLTVITALHDMLTLMSCDEGVLLGEGKVVLRLDEGTLRGARSNPSQLEAVMIENLRTYSKFS